MLQGIVISPLFSANFVLLNFEITFFFPTIPEFLKNEHEVRKNSRNKPVSIRIQEIHLQCDCIDGSFVNEPRQSNSMVLHYNNPQIIKLSEILELNLE